MWCLHVCVCVLRLLLISARSSPPRRPPSNFACTAHMCLLPPHAHIHSCMYIYICIYKYTPISVYNAFGSVATAMLHACILYAHMFSKVAPDTGRSNPGRRHHKQLKRSTSACTAHLCLSLSLSLSLLISLNISLYIHKYMVIYFLARPLSASAPPFFQTGLAATSCNVRLLSRESEGSTLLFRFSYTNTCIQICN